MSCLRLKTEDERLFETLPENPLFDPILQYLCSAPKTSKRVIFRPPIVRKPELSTCLPKDIRRPRFLPLHFSRFLHAFQRGPSVSLPVHPVAQNTRLFAWSVHYRTRLAAKRHVDRAHIRSETAHVFSCFSHFRTRSAPKRTAALPLPIAPIFAPAQHQIAPQTFADAHSNVFASALHRSKWALHRFAPAIRRRK